ncbi:NUDIX hydrolase [Commensalibacter oyaizuii]|uniref:NUDIX domain-containing protein n=1 Tax=Commensalibacter oyaizuii TaxID=3043873 RepID=A0ABT6PZW8_9PROT|nr:NUDIX domain-containing protein [Commensalibacter sp. TBRC 16381]MDI2090407.1 NUDIX domain-containing protein [Commensalibacter sp. TBRC 16381]
MQPSEFKNLLQHIQHCNTANLGQDFLPLQAHKQIIGWVRPDFMQTLYQYGVVQNQDKIDIVPPDISLEELGQRLIADQHTKTMNELFDIYPTPYAKPVGQIDRSVLPLLGMIGTGVHLNGLVKKGNDVYLWVGHRSPHKRLDPGKLDHIVAGGIPAGHTHQTALAKEAEEEANIPQDLIAQAEYTSMVTYSMIRPEGLRRDVLYCYDLWLPQDFKPTPNDGEVAGFELMKIEDAYQRVCTTNDFKFNINLVLIDLFLRLGIISKKTANAQILKTGLRGKLFP